MVSVHTEPIGSLVIEVPPEGLSGEQIKATVTEEFAAEIASRLDSVAAHLSAVPPFLASRQRILSSAPNMTSTTVTAPRSTAYPWALRSVP